MFQNKFLILWNKKTFNMKSTITLLFFVFSLTVNAQIQVITTIGNITGSNTVNVPVTVDNFNNIGALSLMVLYDNTIAAYEGLANTHPSLIGTFGFDAGGSIGLSWLDMTLMGVSLPNGEKLFDLVFNQISEGTTTISFDSTPGSCEYADIGTNALAAIFNDGSITFNTTTTLTEKENQEAIIIFNDQSIEIVSDNPNSPVSLIDINGKVVAQFVSNKKHNIGSLSKGIYIVKTTNLAGEAIVKKVLF